MSRPTAAPRSALRSAMRRGICCSISGCAARPGAGTPIAQAKAYTAAVLETPTSALHARLQQEGLSLTDFCDGGLTSLAGGVPLTLDGKTLGGLGVSGRKPVEDEALGPAVG